MPPFQQTQTEEIDHREEALGPGWVPARTPGPAPERWEQGICPSGNKRVAASAIVQAILKAQRQVLLSSFLLSDEQIANALFEVSSKRGVRVYVLNAAEARLEKEPREDSEFDRDTYEAHKQLMNRLAGHVLFRTAKSFHAKVVLVDAPSGEGYLLTANLTSKALERNEELAVRLTPAECEQVRGWLAYAFWEGAEHEMTAPGALEAVRAPGWVRCPEPAGNVFATASGHTGLSKAILGIVERARGQLVVTSFGWAKDHPVVQRIIERARQGLKVTVLARIRPVAMPALLALREAGATVLGFAWLHAKVAWNDMGEAIVTSANLEPHGLDEGFELGVLLTGARAQAVASLLAAWASGARASLVLGLKVGSVLGPVEIWRGGKSLEKLMVEATREVDLGRVVAESATRLESPAPRLPSPEAGKFFQRTVKRWTIEAPVLDKGAKEVLREVQVEEEVADEKEAKAKGAKGKAEKKVKTKKVPHEPPLFRETNGRIVVAVSKPEQIDAAFAYGRQHGATAVVRRP